MSTTSTASRTWRSLPRRPQWLAALAVALVFAVLCLLLAQWQWHRKEARDARNAAVVGNYDRAPVPAVTALAGAGPSASAEWLPITVEGRYETSATVLVRNRTLGGANGYLVVVPLVLEAPVAGRDELWLMRGWVRAGDDADVPPTVQPPASGAVTVVARLRAPEPATGRMAVPGQAHRIEVEALAAGAERDPAAAFEWYGVVATEDPPGNDGGAVPQPLPRPTIDPGPHLAYTVQWYLFAIAGFAIWGVLYRRVDQAPPGAGRPTGGAPGDPWTYAPGQ